MYSNFCDENHTYYLAHAGRLGMKWGKHIFGGRDKAFSKSGVRRAQTYTNGKKLGGSFGVYSRTAFDKEKNAVGEYINRGNSFNLNPGPYRVGLGLNQSRGSRGNDRTKDALRTAGSSNSKWYEQATTAQRKRGVTGMAGRNVRGAVDDVKSKIRAGRNHGLKPTNKPSDAYREYLSASSATVRKTASKGFPSPTQPGETFKRRKDGAPKIGHYTKHPEQKKSAAPSKNEIKAKPQSGQRRHHPPKDPIEARNLLDSTKQLARATGASQGNEREYRRFLEAQYGRSGNKRKRGARR